MKNSELISQQAIQRIERMEPRAELHAKDSAFRPVLTYGDRRSLTRDQTTMRFAPWQRAVATQLLMTVGVARQTLGRNCRLRRRRWLVDVIRGNKMIGRHALRSQEASDK